MELNAGFPVLSVVIAESSFKKNFLKRQGHYDLNFKAKRVTTDKRDWHEAKLEWKQKINDAVASKKVMTKLSFVLNNG